MAETSPTILWEDLRKGKPAQVYLLHGSEEFLLARATKALISHLADESVRDFNYVEFKGPATDATAFVSAVFTPPMFAPHRLVLLREAQAITWSDELAATIADLPESTYLIVLGGGQQSRENATVESDSAKSTGKRTSPAAWKKVLQAAAEKGRCLEFRPIPKWELEGWVQREGQSLGITLTREAAAEIVSRAGTELRALATELEKVVTFAGPSTTTITPREVSAVVGQASLGTIFDLIDAIGARNASSALRSLQDLLDAGEAPQYLLFMIVRQYRQLLIVKSFPEESRTPSRLFRPLGTGSEYVVQKCIQQAKRLSLATLEEGIAAAFRTDLRLKSGGAAAPDVELQTLIATLCA